MSLSKLGIYPRLIRIKAPNCSVKEFDQSKLDQYSKDIVKDALTDLVDYLIFFKFLIKTSIPNVYEVTGSFLEFDTSIIKRKRNRVEENLS